LAPIRHAGATDDERLRLLFVALTRAKYGLHLTSYATNYAGRNTKRLKYLDEQEQTDGQFMSRVLPPHAQVVQTDDFAAPELKYLELDWHARHVTGISNAQLRGLLEDRLKNYRLSPTHLNVFTDVELGGPEHFFYSTILRFPQAPTLASQYGSAVHDTMEWVQYQVSQDGRVPALGVVVTEFTRFLAARKLPEQQMRLELERGERALSAYLTQRGSIFKPGDKAEQNFRDEGVFLGDAHLTGKVDRMEITEEKKEIVVVDYKTGKAHDRWKAEARLNKYKRQLYGYKLLIENSRTFRGYTVTGGRLEFLEPDANGKILHLSLSFNDAELKRTAALLQAMWSHVMRLDFPDTQDYSHNLKGILEFEADLLGNS
jgi:DNA helicase II / ATP-dependent DNA helicase PcrA